MKNYLKIVAVLLMVSSLFATFGICSYATVPYGSEREEADREAFGCNDSDSLLRYYNGAFLGGFAKGESVEELLSDAHVLDEVVIVIPLGVLTNGTRSYCLRNGEFEEIVYGKDTSKEIQMLFHYVKNPSVVKKYMKKGAVIQNTICLNGNASNDGIYIYYQTDVGDYVLYQESVGEKAYLFPLDEFVQFAKAVHEAKVKASTNENGELLVGTLSIDIEQLYNVKPFEIKETNAFVVVIAVLAVVAVCTLVVALVVTSRKKRTSKR